MNPTMVIDGHLGGYVAGEHGDEATYYPALWRWLVETLGVKSVLDLGCGEGHAARFFATLLPGDNVTGVDGMPQECCDEPRGFVGGVCDNCGGTVKSEPPWTFVKHDFYRGAYSPAPVDLIWCCEFVEHVSEEYMPNFLETFKSATRYVALTHAGPGQAGYHHVNCRTADYWIGAMAAIGFELKNYLTRCARLASEANPSPWNHFKRSGMIFAPYK